MAVLITTTDKVENIRPKNRRDFKLSELQDYVGGSIEVVPIPGRDMIMIVNENGKYECEPNPIATDYAHDNGAIFPTDYISGNVVICKDDMVR